MHRKKVMVFCDYYLPGFKSGGGMWTVVNLVERFSDNYEFYVVTRNHDGKADRKPYDSVKNGRMEQRGLAKVFYLGPRATLRGELSVNCSRKINPDIVFLNSVFSLPSITFLRTRKNPEFSRIPVIVLALRRAVTGYSQIEGG
jgi:hypothetical protein